MARTSTSPLSEFTRLISWHRRKLAVLAAMGAAVAGISAATPEPPPSVSVVVASRQLSGGRQLTASDLSTVDLPESAVPSAALTDPAPLIGRTLVAPLSEGSVLTDLSVLGPRPDVRAGMVIAPLRISDAAVVGLLRVGDRVDVVASNPESDAGAKVIADQVRVVTIPKPAEDTSQLSPTSGDPQTLLLIEVTRDQATALADAAATSQLSVLLG
ncbi:Flp pilus assembly protein CpaB [Microlunatus elymi]|uniref:Flp pilus assembly protein CpaB n=1 Tax=Microlunatus elymi TaxID=2596828 RepID=A0A516Q3M1_9ACTN|nr:Flp pilus assembly protein CpaB [Microlunatus elymi]QDP98025.1 Flp pilus assembly protein CpaB [Microlunatus elymi]